MDFWTMVSFGEIYPCRSVIVSILILAHFVTASTLLQVDAVIYLPTHILFFFILAESLKSVIHNEKKNHYYFNYLQHRRVQHRY